jgi:C1A family cysteine protease
MRRFLFVFGMIFLLVAFAAPFAAAQQTEEGWVRGHTPLSDLTYEEKLSMLGWQPNPDLGHLPRFQSKKSIADVPSHLDWRENGGDFVTGVRNQSDCGSCYAFSGVGAVESAWAIALGMSNPDLDLSEQFIVSCHSLFGCDGGWMTDVLVTARDVGIPDEDCFEYTAADSSCGRKCDGWAKRTLMLESFELVCNEEADTPEEYEAIILALQEGPLTVGFDVYEDFFDYERGIYDGGGMFMGGHGVVIIGYDIDAKYWICKNSWGSSWGESGTFRIEWGESGLGREILLPRTPPCTGDDIYVKTIAPGQDFIRYDNESFLPVMIRVTDDCGRGVAYADVASTINGTAFAMFDDGEHGDAAAADGIFSGNIPAAMIERGPATIQVVVTQPGARGDVLTVNGEFKYAAEVLLIADDNDYPGFELYGRMLKEAGVDYDTWRVVREGRFPTELLDHAPAIVWFTGPGLGTFTDEQETALSAYMDAGGKLLVIGQDMLMNVYDRYMRFSRNYLKIQTYYNDTTPSAVGGVNEEPLTTGIACQLDFPFPNYADTLKLMEGAAPIWRNQEMRTVGLRYPPADAEDMDDIYRLALTSFPLEAMPEVKATEFVTRVMDWFFDDVCLDTDGDTFGFGGACVDVQDCQNDDPEVYPGQPEICDDGKDNDCNGLTDLEDPECEGFADDDDDTAPPLDDDDDDTAPVDDDDDDATDDDDDAADDDDDDNDSGGCA